MKFWLRHFWLASFLIISASSACAAPLLYPLTPEQGLSQGSVNDLMIDKEGFLWLATAGGVNRYDSNQITQLSSSAHRLKELRFTQIMQDSSERIWAASATSGIYLYNPQSGLFDPFMPMPPQAEQQRQSQLIALIEYDENTLLFAIDDAVYKLPLQTATPQLIFRLSDHGIKNGWVRTLLQHDKHLFIGAFNGLIHFDISTGKHQYIPYLLNSQATDNQKHIKYLKVQQERLWIGTVEGLYSINYQDLSDFLQQSTPFTAQENIPQRNIWDLHWQQQQALVATEQGLYLYTPQLSHLSFVLKFSDSALSLFDNNIVDIVADKDGGYWLASRDDGAFYWHPRSNAFSHLSRSTQQRTVLSNDKVYSLLNGDSDTLWVGTSNGLNKLQLSTGDIKHYFVNNDPKALWHSGTVNRLFAVDSKLWFSSGSGLNYFDPETEQLLPLPVNNDANATLLGTGSSAYYLHQGIFYFITANDFMQYNPEDGSIKPLHAFRNQLQRSYYRGILGSLPQRPEQLVIAAADQLWLYDTRQQQLTRFYQYEEYMPELQRRPSSMLQDKRGILWVGFPGLGLLGFNSLNLELKYHFSEANQLASDAVYSLQQDNNGDIWFSSQQGISRLNPDTLKIEHFTKTDGLTVHEFNNSSGIRLIDGKLAFGSMRGLTFVDPDQLQTEKIKPRIAITDISLQSNPEQKITTLLNNRSLTYPHDALGIQIHFSSLNFRDSHKMRYRFWLQGNKTYHYPEQSNNQVIFPQLDSGHYIFNVVSVSPVTGEESPPAQLFLYIKPAPWLSGWAITAYVLLLLLLGHRIYRFRRKQHLLLKSAHDKAKLSEQRLKQALESVNSGAWEWQAKGNIIFASRIYTMLGYDEQMNPLSMNQHLLLIHPDDRAGFEQQWQLFLQQTEQLFDITYRMRHRNEQWLWFRDQGKATELTEDGKISKVSGTFSNITETRASQEKAKLFGEAFRQARDWVVILDAQQRVVAANQSFSVAFDYTASQLEQPKVHHLGISLVRRRFYTQLLHTLIPGQHWQGEELIITPDGRERPTLINVSAVGERQQVAFFVLVFTDITAQKQAEEELRYMANYDAMTGLPNRTLLMDRIYHGIEQAKRANKTLALCFIDLDRFKHINDSLGHDIGDLLLKEVARRLKLTLRESDTVARLGGDEFVVLLEGYKNEDNISHVARKMLSIVSQPMLLSTHTVGISPSIGIAIYPDDAINAAELLKHADVAMYHAKEAGRNNFQFFTAEMNEKAYMQLARETRLRQALQQNEFINYYQPIINTLNNSVVGVEVLLRWNTAEGIVSPYHFIPLAEELRLIVNITQRLLERALADLKQWRQHGYDIYLSVNLSTQHLEQTNLAEQTQLLLEKYQLPASCLRFEVTESALMRDHQSAIETMLALSKLGILLALDDFGTGYSSLKYLKELPIDAIKIDRSFVQDIGIDNNDETIIETMLTMASSLGMYCVAEGVETERQLAFFTQRGCCLIQGYLFSVPLPANELQKLLDSNQFTVPRRKDVPNPT